MLGGRLAPLHLVIRQIIRERLHFSIYLDLHTLVFLRRMLILWNYRNYIGILILSIMSLLLFQHSIFIWQKLPYLRHETIGILCTESMGLCLADHMENMGTLPIHVYNWSSVAQLYWSAKLVHVNQTLTRWQHSHQLYFNLMSKFATTILAWCQNSHQLYFNKMSMVTLVDF